MQTVILEQPGQLRLTSTAAPEAPGPGEALVRVRRVGICGTDIHAFKGEQPFFSYPRVLGHELGVEVMAIGPVERQPELAVGDYCSVNPYLNCGHCSACRRGLPSPAQPLARISNFGSDSTGGITARVNEVGSSIVIVYIPKGSPVSRVVPPSV